MSVYDDYRGIILYYTVFWNGFWMYVRGVSIIRVAQHIITIDAFLYILRNQLVLFDNALKTEFHLKNDYETIISTIEEILIKIDRQGDIMFINKKLFDMEPAKYITKNVKNFPIFDVNLIDRVFAFKEKNSWTISKNDRQYTFKVSPIMELNNRVDSCLVVCNDITDSTQNKENELRRITAETSLKSKIEFIASISHEIRNPLQAINYTVENLLETNLDFNQKDLISDIKFSNQIASRIISDILDLSKIESGKMKMVFERMNILDTFESALDYNYFEAKKKNLILYYDLNPKLPRSIISDQSRVTQIANNLIANAIKYSEKGHVRISLDFRGEMLRISVKDNGIGIKQVDQVKMFKPFEQFNSKSMTHQGWGLGLSICKKLVDLLGGEIGLESKFGLGSTFWFEIPIRDPSIDSIVPNFNPVKKDIIIIHPCDTYGEFLASVIATLKPKSLNTYRALPQVIEEDSIVVVHHLYLKEIQKLDNFIIIGEFKETSDQSLKEPLKVSRLLEKITGVSKRKSNEFTEGNREIILLKDKSILVCEDNIIVHKSLLKLLQTNGVENLHSAYNGLECVNQIKEGKFFDIILMDIQMPLLDGIEATKLIRNLQKDSDKKSVIIICSGNSFHTSTDNLKQEWEVDDILVKPITKKHLFKVIEKFK